MTRKLGRASLAVVLIAAIGMLLVALLGSASGLIDRGNARAFGVQANIAGIRLGPLPEAIADEATLSATAKGLEIKDFPTALLPVVHELTLLGQKADVNPPAGVARAESKTLTLKLLGNLGAGIKLPGLLGGPLPLPNLGGVVPGGLPPVPPAPNPLPNPGLPGLPGVPNPPGAGGLLPHSAAANNPGSSVPIIGDLPGVSDLLSKTAAALVGTDLISLQALHSIVNLDCAELATLRSASAATLLNAVTKAGATNTDGSEVLGLKIPLLGLDLHVVNSVTGAGSIGLPVGSAGHVFTDRPDHMSGLHISLIDSLLPVPITIGSLDLYEATGTNLRSTHPETDTLSASLDMLHLQLLPGIITGLGAVDLKLGHADASLVNCKSATRPTPGGGGSITTVIGRQFSVDLAKTVETIAGRAISVQSGLIAKPLDQVGYSISAFNTSPIRADNTCAVTKVVDQLPAHFSFVSDAGGLGNGTLDPATNTVTWSNLALANQQAARQGIVVRVDSNAPAGDYVNVVTATGSCGTFIARSAPIHVGSAILGRQFRTAPVGPARTGLPDEALYILGAIFTVTAAGGVRVLRRR